MTKQTNYDVVIVGGGHNGLVSACYLAKAGLSVAVLERNSAIGGATRSKQVFSGLDARLSVYSYLVSLFPGKIVNDLSLNLKLRSRGTASWTPVVDAEGRRRDLLIRNNDPGANLAAFREFCGHDQDYRGCQHLEEMQQQLASLVWPGLTQPLLTRQEMKSRLPSDATAAWQALIEEPIGRVIEREIQDDAVRGLVLTDARIGVSVHPHEESLLQNRCFLYHVIGNGTGEWRVPVGGMGTLVNQLTTAAVDAGAELLTGAEVCGIEPGPKYSTIRYTTDEQEFCVDGRFVLSNASADVLDGFIGQDQSETQDGVEGAGFKINMLLKRLPRLRATRTSAASAFAGTVHLNEGYQQQIEAYEQTLTGTLPSRPPGEIYCHTLTDDSILSSDLREQGFHTITLFGLDMPYRLFVEDNGGLRGRATGSFLAGINEYLDEPIEDCLATDANGDLCVEAKSAVDLESELRLPRGNIFHGDLTWPFTDDPDRAGTWGVETNHANIFLCGSSAARGGAVSGIPGHNAAMKVLDLTTGSISS